MVATHRGFEVFARGPQACPGQTGGYLGRIILCMGGEWGGRRGGNLVDEKGLRRGEADENEAEAAAGGRSMQHEEYEADEDHESRRTRKTETQEEKQEAASEESIISTRSRRRRTTSRGQIATRCFTSGPSHTFISRFRVSMSCDPPDRVARQPAFLERVTPPS